MARLRQVNDITSGGSKEMHSKFVEKVINGEGSATGRVGLFEVPLEEITPRSINKFRQSRIEKLAKSIRNTNNRLIHPITLVKAADLPKDSAVLKAYENKGVDISQIKYIIVAGERRYRAFCLLQQEENEKIKQMSGRSALGAVNPFDTITASILTPAEAKNENIFYEDSNIESRQLTPIEAILHVKDVVSEVTSPEEMRVALIEMNDGSEEGIPKSDSEIRKKFRKDKYCAYTLKNELGIETVSESTIRSHLAIINNCSETIIDALIAGSYPIREARNITKFTHEIQEELLTLWQQDEDGYSKKINELTNKDNSNEKRVTGRDARKRLSAMIEKTRKEISDLKDLAEKLGAYDRDVLTEGIHEIERIEQELNSIVKETIEKLK